MVTHRSVRPKMTLKQFRTRCGYALLITFISLIVIGGIIKASTAGADTPSVTPAPAATATVTTTRTTSRPEPGPTVTVTHTKAAPTVTATKSISIPAALNVACTLAIQLENQQAALFDSFEAAYGDIPNMVDNIVTAGQMDNVLTLNRARANLSADDAKASKSEELLASNQVTLVAALANCNAGNK